MTAIRGYRTLTEKEIDQINEVKSLGERLGVLIQDLRFDEDVDHRWVSIGETQLQQGLMALTRAVARPNNF